MLAPSRFGRGSPRFCYTYAPSLPSRRACELLVVESPLMFRRCPVTDGRVPPLLVVEHLDVVERQVLAAADGLEALPELELEGREPALHRSVVVAVASSAHAAGDAVLAEHLLVVLAGVRAALVGVMEQAHPGAPTAQRLVERRDGEVPVVDRADRPPDDQPGVEVDDRREVELPRRGQQFGRV